MKTFLQKAKLKYYLVGGSIRDKLLNIKTKDIDVAVISGNFNQAKEDFLDAGGEIFTESKEYLTFRGRIPELGAIDVKVARAEGVYHNGRHPSSVVPVKRIEDDLKFRDFTVNAIAQDLDTGELIDPFNGQGDIKSKIIRTVGKAEDRFREDFLRLIRALRFSVTKGFRITYEIHEILLTDWAIDGLINVSVERIYEELRKMFEHDSRLSFDVLNRYDKLRNKIFDMGVKLEPTLKE